MRHKYIIISLGISGAFLQFSEFEAVKQGLPVHAISFLIFTLPLWTLFLTRLINHEQMTLSRCIKALLTAIGATVIVVSVIDDFAISVVILPLIAAISLSFWVCASRKLSQEGVPSHAISALYDGLSMVFLMPFLISLTSPEMMAEDIVWLSDLNNAFKMIMFSVIFGLVANLLFYNASKYHSAFSMSLAIGFEPIIATIASVALFQEVLHPEVLFACTLIFLANTPNYFYLGLWRGVWWIPRNIMARLSLAQRLIR